MYSSALKPFALNSTDIDFLLSQVKFRPLFDMSGNALINWDGKGAIYDFRGSLIWDGYSDLYSSDGVTLLWKNADFDLDGLPTLNQSEASAAAAAAVSLFGTSYQNGTDLSGLRDPSGHNNNLAVVHAFWGAADQLFPRMAAADFTNFGSILSGGSLGAYAADLAYWGKYSDGSAVDGSITGAFNVNGSQNAKVDYTISIGGAQKANDGAAISISNIVDYTPRMISLLTTTAGVQYDTWANPVHTLENLPLGHSALYDSSGNVIVGWNGVGAIYDANNDLLWDGVSDINGAVIPRSLSSNTLWIVPDNAATMTAADVQASAAAARAVFGTSYAHAPNEIYYDAFGVASVVDWGDLKLIADGGLGQVDTQARLDASAGIGEQFIGGLNPGVSPSNSFFVTFGQFFDHGLDFIDKGAQGKTIKIAFSETDPLYGMKGPDGQPVHEITIARASVQSIDANGPQYADHTSPYVDQSQTYGSHEQLTTLLREWVKDVATGKYHSGMNMLNGHTLATAWKNADGEMVNDTLPTLNELRAHLEATGRGGANGLIWEDVINLRNRDMSDGHLTGGNSDSALILDMNPRFDEATLHEGNGTQDSAIDLAIRQLSDFIASSDYQNARPGDTFAWAGEAGSRVLTWTLATDLNMGPGNIVPKGTVFTGANAMSLFVNFSNMSVMSTSAIPVITSQNVHDAVSTILLASVGDHYIAGDGRVNENFGLTSIHHVFHEEHNFQVTNFINALHREAVSTNSFANLHAFQIAPDATNGITEDPATHDYIKDGQIAWDLDKMFNAVKLVVEMEYQHAAVDQYARNVTPNIQEFVGYSPDKDPSVTLEFAQSAFRFGHSTLRETIDTIDPTHGLTGKIMGYALRDAFLNPGKYMDLGPASIIMGMTHQQMNEVDEFITPALNQGLLGQPLDLAAINIARGRDIGIPTLNDLREALGLVRYSSWTEFASNMQHSSSLVNFIAAYSFDGNLAAAQEILDLVDGVISVGANGMTAAEAFAFLEGGDLGFDKIDSWLGGLAEIHQPGGLLGETFDLIFVSQIESLMDGDRFYYLYRLAGQQFAEEVGGGQLKDIVERNTGLTHLNGNIFGYADKYYDFGAKKEVTTDGTELQTTANNHKYGDVYATTHNADGSINFEATKVADGALTRNPMLGIYTNTGRSSALDGTIVTIAGKQYIRDTRLEDKGQDTGAALLNDGLNLDGTPNSGAESNEILVGTERNDLIYANGGDDTVYGEGGDDIIYGGFGIDRLYGGDGSDRIYGSDNPDLIDGGSGDDFLYGESSGSDINGNDQVIGGSGNDFVSGGVGIDKLSGGTGDDHVVGDQDTDPFTHGSDGNDLLEGNSGGDILYGDNGDDVLIGGADQDQMFGGNGDDIIRPGDLTGALTIGTDETLGGDGITDIDGNGKQGFDIIDFSDNVVRAGGVVFDLGNQINPAVTVNGTPTQTQAFQMEGVIGSAGDDTLSGGSTNAAGDVDNDWIIGGSGNDTLAGGAGNDIIVGGSIRLDSLIGSYQAVEYYTATDADVIAGKAKIGEAKLSAAGTATRTGAASTYDHNNNNIGSSTDEQLMDARYQGASHRVGYADQLSTNGLIDTANSQLGLSGDAAYAKHFNDVLRTDQFKDLMLGDGQVDGASDTVVLTGNRNEYTIQRVTYGDLTAYRIVDTVADRDGSDLLIGVDNFKFADSTLSLAMLLNVAPVISSDGGLATAEKTMAENSTLVTTVVATDANNIPGDALYPQTLKYAISTDVRAENADASKFQIDSNTGVLSFVASPSFETPTDAGANNVYNVIVTVSDGLAVDTQALTVTIGNVDEAATGALNVESYVNENNRSVAVTAVNTLSDPDGMASFVNYQWQQLTNGNWVNIAANQGGNGATLTGQTSNTLRVVSTYIDPFGTKTFIAPETVVIGSGAAGNAGNNTLVGTGGKDFIIGLAGNDSLAGGLGNNLLDGGTGTDTAVFGQTVANSTFAINQTNQLIVSGAGSVDTLIGIERGTFSTDGSLTIRQGTAATDTLNAGQAPELFLGFGGIDTVSYNAANNAITANLATGVASNGDRFVSIENLTGSANADTLTGDASANVLTGGSGNDTLTGGVGNDTLSGGNGTDVAVFTGIAANYDFSATTVTDRVGTDGTDTINSIETLRFNGANYNMLSTARPAVSNYSETFASTSYTNADGAWTTAWQETGDTGDNNGNGTLNGNNTTNAGQIRINNGRLEFDAGSNAANSNGAEIVRAINGMAGASSATLSYNYTSNFDTGETVNVLFAADGVNFNQTVQTINGSLATGAISNFVLNGPFSSNAAIKFVVSGTNLDNDIVSIDNIAVSFSAPNTLTGDNGNNIMLGDVTGSMFNGGAGNDVIRAGDGNDTITQLSTDGHDYIDGGAGNDTYVLQGTAAAEIFNIYSRDAWLALGTGHTAASTTGIVVTRNGTTDVNVVAELSNVEEFRVNGSTQAGTTTNGFKGVGSSSGDTVNVIGNFVGTGLAYNTITVNGADNTVDITNLTSAHRVVMNTDGGAGSIVGASRPQDILNTGVQSIVEASLSGISPVTSALTVPTEPVAVRTFEPLALTATTLVSPDTTYGGLIDSSPLAIELLGTKYKDILQGGASNDNLSGLSGDDEIFGLAGNDLLSGGKGNDRIFGGDGVDNLLGGKGNDYLDGGDGADRLSGGSGKDVFHFGDGDLILDFHSGQDLIDLRDVAVTASNFSEMLSVSQNGSTLQVSIGDASMSLLNANSVDFTDFLFASEGDDIAAMGNALSSANLANPDKASSRELTYHDAHQGTNVAGEIYSDVHMEHFKPVEHGWFTPMM